MTVTISNLNMKIGYKMVVDLYFVDEILFILQYIFYLSNGREFEIMKLNKNLRYSDNLEYFRD